jgi:hypothetical protein
MRQGMLTPEYGVSTMKISAERFIDRLMMTTHLRGSPGCFAFSFALLSGVMYSLQPEKIELLLTIFKVA